MKRSNLLILALIGCFPYLAFTQTGVIAGKVIDTKFAEGLIGCSVKLDENGGGAITDLDGNFAIRGIAPGKHKITVNYTGYPTKVIEEIEVKANEATTVDVAMEEPTATVISEVVIVAKAQRESMSALTILQKTSPVIADGISAESIKRTPDRTTGDVIRRISGASIQDGRFAVIRGLTDRYNVALLNGALLPSTEPDRKAFSFDLFPASFIDNLLVMKTASPDLPGEFAGGAILLNTRDIPEENYVRLNVSGGYNTVTTFNSHWSTPSSGTDWLGYDNGARALSGNFPATRSEYISLPKEERIRLSSSNFANDWAYTRSSSALPNGGFQLSSGFVTNPERKTQLGTTVALSYNNTNTLRNAERGDYDLDGKLFEFNDEQFRNNVLFGGLFNTALKIGSQHKVSLQAIYSTNTSNTSVYRTGARLKDNEGEVIATSTEFIENHLLITRLGGEHSFGERGIKLNWGGGFNRSTRDVPSLRRTEYSRQFTVPGEEPEPFRAYIPFGSAALAYGGRFYADLTEDAVNGNVDLSIPFALGGIKQTLKVGGLYQQKDRTFNARVLGVTRARVAGFDNSLLVLPQEQIFAAENFKDNGFIIDDITNPSDEYTAQSALTAAYAMFDNKIGEKFRITWGARLENFRQKLQSIDYTNAPVDINRPTTNILPSANLTYSLNDKHQLRFSASQTVTRPEFREIAPFSFYDFELNAAILGNPSLSTGTIRNFDLRYEFYPGQNQMLSVSTFYKRFDNPIEFTFFSQGAGTRTFSYQNVPSANNYGVEAEIRKNLDFVGAGWERVVLFSNVALIKSELDLSNVSYYDKNRPLQGQSPYIFNGGVTYNASFGLSATAVYNVIGDRIAQVGTGDPITGEGYGDIYERHRNLLDLSVSQRLGKSAEIKLTWSDVLRPDFVFYQDNNRNHRFDEAEDNVMQRINLGGTVAVSLGWRF